MKEQYLRMFFTSEARLRLNNIKMVKPEVAETIEDQVIQLGTAGKISHPITDEELKALLAKFGEQRREFKIRYIERRLDEELSSHKTSGEKKRYIKRLNQNSGAPTWVVVKTNRKVSRNPKQRNWRSRKLNL